eukprot:TRINITY_DN7730_c1_g1_i1.p1 TRINITY_DN7730_c1_g1~~TRINITY_DN7730_c1_g1_i1.p1  ORF type:complete len:551 (+),score=179.93 TRINITY_DN7730_c1_g1_i1:252-1904(+)
MMIEKMNAFYLKNWDKEQVFDLSQRVVARKERHWTAKFSPHLGANLKQWKHTYSATPFHKSADGQAAEHLQTTAKPKWFWIEPSADFFVRRNLPGCDHDFQLAWADFYEELEKAAYIEPEQMVTLLHDLVNEGWTVSMDAYSRAEQLLYTVRERRVLGIKPPTVVTKVKRRERWPGSNPLWDVECNPVKPYTYGTQSNPSFTYKPVRTEDLVYDPASWMDGPLPKPVLPRWETSLRSSSLEQQVMADEDRDERFKQLLDQQNQDIYSRRDSFQGDPKNFVWVKKGQNDPSPYVDENGVPLLMWTDVEYFIEKFYMDDDIAECLLFWKYTSDHILLRHLVFMKTGRTLLEYTEPERFAILIAVLEVKRTLLFFSDLGKELPHCWTDQDYIDLVGIDDYQRFLRMDGRRIDEERKRYLRLWSTEVAQEERLDQVVELTKTKHEEDQYKYGGIYGMAMKVRDQLDRKKWSIKEPSRQVQEHEKLMNETREERRALLEEEQARLREEAEASYGNEWRGMQNPVSGQQSETGAGASVSASDLDNNIDGAPGEGVR